MRSTRAGLALAGTIALSALAGGVVLGPALATAATTEESASAAVTQRVDRLREALQGLVSDGTLDEQQADRVAETLAEQLPPRGRGDGPGRGRGHGQVGKQLALDVAAQVLGLSEDELRTELRAGKSLATVAQERGVAVEDLTAALQTAAEERLDAAVADGRLTQEQADERRAELPERVAGAVEREGLGKGHGKGGGEGRGRGPGAGAPPAEDAPQTEGSSFRS